MLIDFLKNILYVFVICVFLFLILGQPILEGFEEQATDSNAPSTEESTDSKASSMEESTDSKASSTTDAPITKATSSSVSELFEKVNTQADIIRTFKGDFNPIVPLKIDGSGDESVILLNNIKLLLNNGVFKNETDLKSYEYTGNKAVNTLVSEVNNLNLEKSSSITDIDKKEIDYINKTRDIIYEHQKIIDLELKRRAK
jgi:hypothetical protein